jgi:hypothetical protein
MVCRMWHGWTSLKNADAYDSYLKNELFPHVKQELEPRGYRGFHVLRVNRGREAEFVTMVWFESLEAVQSFAGEHYETPVISDKALKLLSHYDSRSEHYQLSGFDWPLHLV